MKILPVEKIREADAYTIENEPIPSIDLMERAATQLYLWIKYSSHARQPVKIFAGPGNNGGDGLALGRLLSRVSPRVEVYPIRFTDKTSGDFQINYERLKQTPKVKVVDVYENDPLPEIHEGDLVVEAIFGSGLSKPVKGFPGKVIEHINASHTVVVAVDTPSGLFSDKPSTTEKNTIIKADYTLSFQFPKLAFLFPENDQFVGEWHVLPIRLHADFINRVDVKNYLVEKADIEPSLKKRNKFQHKGHFGHALLVAGAYGKMGAAVLAARACLRAGPGLLTAHIPKAGYPIIQTAVPEAMTVIDSSEHIFSDTGDIAPFNAIGVGPGIGMEKQTQNALKLLIQNSSVPLLFDA
ncbi:MAG: NAD(P)H-hydrate epimerase, partial [Bacteroidales bacterium]|nr:NAD(P)H-hydrate epimerase [Bacteroidales bacterium]